MEQLACHAWADQEVDAVFTSLKLVREKVPALLDFLQERFGDG